MKHPYLIGLTLSVAIYKACKYYYRLSHPPPTHLTNEELILFIWSCMCRYKITEDPDKRIKVAEGLFPVLFEYKDRVKIIAKQNNTTIGKMAESAWRRCLGILRDLYYQYQWEESEAFVKSIYDRNIDY